MSSYDAKKIMRSLGAAVTVGELRDMLGEFDDDALVAFSCDYGDHGHTEQVLPIGEAKDVSVSELCLTAYSQSGVALEREADWDDEDTERESSETDGVEVVILS